MNGHGTSGLWDREHDELVIRQLLESEVGQHLEECPACCQQLLELQNDTFVELVCAADTPQGKEFLPAQESVLRHDRRPVCHSDVTSVPDALADHPRYHVLELLGRGGMGDVYKAEHRMMNRLVALKVVNRQLMKDAHASERFRREVRTAARLSHPNIVAAYDAEQAGELHFLVMEFVEGTDLAEVVRRRGPLQVSEACEYIRQAANGLQHAHGCGMVHRDIKPENLMLVGETIKILDFGLARFAVEADDTHDGPRAVQSGRLTSMGATMGTPDYIAPEQSRSAGEPDIRSDIYSLGCTLYFLLTGRPPFPVGTPAEKLHAHAHRDAPPLSEHRDELPVGLEGVLQRMMAKDPGERYQTPDEVAAALEKFAGTASPPAMFVRRSRRVVLALAMLIAAMSFLFAAVFYVRLGETTVKFEIDDPSLAVHFDENEITVQSDDGPIRITPGERQSFTIFRNGLQAQTNTFSLSKGQRVVLRVSVEEDNIAVTPSDRALRLDASPPLTVPEESVALEVQETFQGKLVGRVEAMGVSADHNIVVTSEWSSFDVQPHEDGTGGVFFPTEVRTAVWDVETKHQVAAWTTSGTAGSIGLAVSPDGRRVALVLLGMTVDQERHESPTHDIRIFDARKSNAAQTLAFRSSGFRYRGIFVQIETSQPTLGRPAAGTLRPAPPGQPARLLQPPQVRSFRSLDSKGATRSWCGATSRRTAPSR